MTRCTIIPPYLLARIAAVEEPGLARAAASARRSLMRDEPLRAYRNSGLAAVEGELSAPSGASIRFEPRTRAMQRTISDAGGTETLPGAVVRRETEEATGDAAVDEAHSGLGRTYDLFWKVFSRLSVDGNGMPLDATVHYGEDYDNAFWNGQRMVFGDGDGEFFNRFTVSDSVIGHELTHGITQYTANLTYEGQSGALNESVSDVFGALVEQYANGQSVDQASWLIGAGLFTDRVAGVALRSMKAPGTAYDDPVLGSDPQPPDMAGFVTATDDAGGVHLNSGIPNRAFYLTAAFIGGNAWEAPGRIWYETLIGSVAGPLAVDTDFTGFAQATSAVADQLYGEHSVEHEAVRAAWTTVGVLNRS